jgi:tetratricopeptide (TPR) repeat protein
MNRSVRIGGFCLLLFLLAAGGESSKTQLPPAGIGRLGKEAQKFMAQRRFEEAAQAYSQGAALARSLGDARQESLFLNAAAGAQFAAQRYRLAESAYRRALERARAAGEPELEAVAHINLSSLYTALSDAATGEHELRAAARLLPASSAYWPKLWAQRVYLAARRGDGAAARRWGWRALQAAQDQGDAKLEAQVWDKLGAVALRERRFSEAEEYLAASHRLRVLAGAGPLHLSYLALSRLRLAQGRIPEALRLSTAARAALPPSPASVWWPHYDRALVLRAAGREDAALAEARHAAAGAAEWRRWIMASQWTQLAGDATEASAAALLADLLMTRGGHGAAVEAFLAVEASRAASLHAAAWRSSYRQGRLADAHGETLARLRDHEARRAAGLPVPPGEGEELHARLAALESQAGLGHDSAWRERPSLESLRSRLAPGEVYFSFLAGERQSWGWMLTRDSFRWGPLPPSAALEQASSHLRSVLLEDAGGWQEIARQTGRHWLGWAGPAAWTARRWILSADGPLFTVPWAAFEPGRPYSLIPALSFRQPGPWNPAARPLSAFGDPIYNRADPRCNRLASLWETRSAAPGLEMPRLAGSGDEVRAILRAARRNGWEASAATGAEVNLESVRAALRRSSVLHLAGHVFDGLSGGAASPLLHAAPDGVLPRPREMFLALSLRNGAPELLTSAAVAAALDARDALVVVSGCSSGTGDRLPGAGLQGFTSAWLAAGARAAAGSLWPVSDGGAAFFEDFYGRLAAGGGPAAALAEARLSALAAGGWRARPAAWAGYFVMGKD